MVTFKSAHGEEHQHIYGAVKGDGTSIWGTQHPSNDDYSVEKKSAGHYKITFTNEFKYEPGVIGSIYGDDNSGFFSVSVCRVSKSSFECYTTDTRGNAYDYYGFTFLAFGEKK